MGAFIAKQPNGKYCRFSTIVDCPTHINMTKEDYINYLEKVIASNNNEIRDIKRKNRKIRKRINSFNKQGVVSSKNNGGK